jgi:hypothetical protein
MLAKPKLWLAVLVGLIIVAVFILHSRHKEVGEKSRSNPSSNALFPASLATTEAEANTDVERVSTLAQKYRGLTSESLKVRSNVVREEKAETFTTMYVKDTQKGEKATYVFEDNVPIKVRFTASDGSGYYFLFSPDGKIDQYLEYETNNFVGLMIDYYSDGKPAWVRHLKHGDYFGLTEHYSERGALIESTNYATPTPVVLHFHPPTATNSLQQQEPVK